MQITTASSYNILWQLPQYLVVTIAEVLFSVSGLSFSYSQVCSAELKQ